MKRGRSHASVGLPALRDAAAAASTGGAAEAAHRALADGGSAVDAVIAGFFAAAGALPSLLLGAPTALAAGLGSAVRAFDGRPLQPGKGAPRPRGFVEGQSVPDGARVAVPRSVPMLMLLHAYGGRLGLSSLSKYGGESAEAAGAKVRARVLRRVGAAGVLGLRAEAVHEALLAAGNSVAGGALTEADLDSVLPADGDARVLRRLGGEAVIAGSPWIAEGVSDEAQFGWAVEVVAAVDSRGGMAVLCCAHQPKGVGLPAVELSAPRVAVPVLRGVVRTPLGAVLRAPAPIGVARFGRELSLAFGLAGSFEEGQAALFDKELDAAALAPLGEGMSVESALAALARAHGAARCVAAARSAKAARAVVVVPDAAT